MRTPLEDQLTTGLREHAAGVHLSRDVLAAARARHRRRTAATRTASATGLVGLAGAIATVVAVNGPVAQSPATGRVPAASAPTDVELDAATVSARITQALEAWDDSVHHLSHRLTVGGRTTRGELWEDPVTGDSLVRSGGKGEKVQSVDMAVRIRGKVQTTTIVDRDRRVWWVDTFTFTEGPSFPHKDTPLGDTSPDGLRRALAAGRWKLIGTEKLQGRDTVHLRVTEQAGYDGEYDLWVDATTYQFVRKAVASSTDDGEVEQVEDWEYLPRTAESLSLLELVAPKGFTRIPAPEARG